MQKIILVGISCDKIFDYTLSLGFLKSYALKYDEIKNNSDIEIIEYHLNNHNLTMAVEEILSKKPDIIGFSCYTWNIKKICEISSKIKEDSNATIIFGGPEMTSDSTTYIEHNFADYLIIGEGEKTFSQILKTELKGRKINDSIKGIVLKNKLTNKIEYTGNQKPIENLDDIPSPYISKIIKPKSRRVFIETMRGCNFQCGYCETNRRLGNTRYMSLDRIEAEISSAVNNGNIYSFFFDTCSNQDPERFEQLLNIIIKYDSQFKHNLKHIKNEFLLAQAMMIKAELLNKKSIELLSQTSFKSLEIGLQTINHETLSNINRTLDKKRFKENITYLIKNRIIVFVDLILGLPGDNFFRFMNSLRFLNNLSPSKIISSPLRIVPKSKLHSDTEKYKIKYNELRDNLIIENYSYPKIEIHKSTIFFNSFNKEFNCKIR